MAVSKRKKYDYHLIISDLCLVKEFALYCRKHKGISFNRQARSFLVHYGIDYRKPIYELGNHEEWLQHVIDIAKTPWLD